MDREVQDAPRALPSNGRLWSDIMRDLESFKTKDYDWRHGRLPSYTYFYNDDILAKQIESFSAYITENGLGEGVAFHSLSLMLADIYAIARGLFHAPDTAGATFTGGGTESLFLAVKTCRDFHRALRKEPLGHYNIIAGEAGHATLHKAAQYLDVEIRTTPLDNEYRTTAESLASAIDDRTIMLFTSAPCYPYGVFDRIEEISQLALKRDIWLHVDACWGGFISPFAQRLGYPIPPWDMSLPGVTSLSADLHKFGYAVKGASLILYRDAKLQEHEYFEFSKWARGTYRTSQVTGSRSAGSISSAWALMQYLGDKGYLEATEATMSATMQLIAGINEIPGLKILEPYGESNLFNFVSTDPGVDLMAVADVLDAKGWMRGRMRSPVAIHQGVTASHLPHVEEYLQVVRDAVDSVRASGRIGEYNERTY